MAECLALLGKGSILPVFVPRDGTLPARKIPILFKLLLKNNSLNREFYLLARIRAAPNFLQDIGTATV